MAPEQVRILPISDKQVDKAYEVRDALVAKGIRAEVDDRSEKVGKKIREARLDKLIYWFVIGDNEVENNSVSVSCRFEEGSKTMSVDDAAALLLDEIERKVRRDN